MPDVKIDAVDFLTEDGAEGLTKDKNKRTLITVTGSGLVRKSIVTITGITGTIWTCRLTRLNREYTSGIGFLKCIFEDTVVEKIKEGGTENVSVTVTNPTNGTSTPITIPDVPIIP